MQSELRASQQDETLLFLAHELKGPVSVIVSGTRQLRSYLPASVPHNVLQVLDAVQEESEALVGTIDQLVAFSQSVEAFAPEPVLLHRSIDRVVKHFQAERQVRTVNVRLPSALPVGSGNPFFVETVLRNLLLNADAYSPPSEAIDVTARSLPGELHVSVGDRGHGVESGDLEKIFELFHRGKRTKALAGGSGVGLYLCRRLVNLMGGRIWARPRPSCGLEVTFSLPAYDVGALRPE